MAYPHRRLIKPRLGSLPNRGHRLSRGLVGLWLMNEGTGTSVADLSGNGNTGIISGATWTLGKYGSVLDFVTDDYVSMGDVLDIGSGNMTWVAGLKIDTYVDAAPIIDKRSSAVNTYYQFKTTDTPRVSCLVHDGTNIREVRWNESSTDDMQITIVYDQTDAATGFKAYKDGILKDTDVTALASITNAQPFVLGRRPGSGAAFDGKIDYVFVYNRALSASEIAQLYSEPFCMFKRDDVFWVPSGEPPVGTNIKINISDAWKDVDSIKINIGDVWKDVSEVKQNIGDSWKSVF